MAWTRGAGSRCTKYGVKFPVWGMADTSRPRKVFEAGYEKSARDLYDLTLEEQDFRPSSAKCVEISLGGALSNLDDSKPLIFVFAGA